MITRPLKERQQRLAAVIDCLPADHPGLPLGAGGGSEGQAAGTGFGNASQTNPCYSLRQNLSHDDVCGHVTDVASRMACDALGLELATAASLLHCSAWLLLLLLLQVFCLEHNSMAAAAAVPSPCC